VPLPAVGDALLVKQLAVVVTAGWQLPRNPNLHDEVAYLLEAVPLFSRAGAYTRRAHDFLVMLDEALLAAAESGQADEAFITEEQATGLRILFGTHPAYRSSTARVRRDSAAEYLGTARRGDRARVSGETLYKRRQRELLQMALDCFRLVHGQDPPGLPAQTEIESVMAIINFDELRRISNVFYDYRVRARFHAVDKVYVRTELPAGAAREVDVTGFTGVEFRHTRLWIPGHLSVSFKPPHVLTVGEKLEFGFRIRYSYPAELRHWAGHFMHWEHNDYYRLRVHCHFREPPQECWQLIDSLLYYPSPPKPERMLELDARGHAHVVVQAAVQRMAYGIAWQWGERDGDADAQL